MHVNCSSVCVVCGGGRNGVLPQLYFRPNSMRQRRGGYHCRLLLHHRPGPTECPIYIGQKKTLHNTMVSWKKERKSPLIFFVQITPLQSSFSFVLMPICSFVCRQLSLFIAVLWRDCSCLFRAGTACFWQGLTLSLASGGHLIQVCTLVCWSRLVTSRHVL